MKVTCPFCGSPDRVVPLYPEGDGPADGFQFYCPPCNGVFVGTDAEFARMGPVRMKLREDQKRRTVPR